MPHNLESNKKIAIAFYRTAYLGESSKAIELYVDADYIQHNLAVANRNQGFVDCFEKMAKDYPDKQSSLSAPL